MVHPLSWLGGGPVLGRGMEFGTFRYTWTQLLALGTTVGELGFLGTGRPWPHLPLPIPGSLVLPARQY
jgi:hypothetical protein